MTKIIANNGSNCGSNKEIIIKSDDLKIIANN